MTNPDSIATVIDRGRERKRVAIDAARKAAARRRVLAAYDEARGRRPYDLAGSRRRRALNEAVVQAEDLEHHARIMGATPEELELTELGELTRDQLEFEHLANGLISGRGHVTDAVISALEEARLELRLRRPPILDRALNGDGSIVIYKAGGSRVSR